MFNDKIVFNYMYNLWVAVYSDLSDADVEEIGQVLLKNSKEEYNSQNDQNITDDDFIDMISEYSEDIREQSVSEAEEDIKKHRAPKFKKVDGKWNI
ncbi:hypothetical protein AKUH4B402J_01510 [Apilactobacillus kunkeei]|nr:hypothetical protein AKUH4B402J_01510 [Apilactobacillus kunkeei]